jgi:selenocysteine-specific elongation factor
VAAPSLVIGTAGHIDHGKSTLVRALTGIDPDRLKEEQARGITIDLGFAHAQIHGIDVAFVDVPGHERFVRNMLAGAGGIDAVVLVVAADESVMPQTREHFHICRLLGVDRGVVAITKADLVDRDTLDLVTEDVRGLLAGSPLDGVRMVRVSARTGEGLDDLRTSLATLTGPPRSQLRPDVARLPIDRVFTMRGFGTVVTGTLVSGRIADGQDLVVLPEDRRVRVRGIQAHGRPMSAIDAPHRVALNLSGIGKDQLARGMTIASAGGLMVTRRCEARVRLLAGAPALRHGARVRIHHGTAESVARVLVAAVRDGDGGASWRAAAAGDAGIVVPGGGDAFVRLRCDKPMVVTRGDRFVLRALSPATTIGGGTILDPDPPAGGLRRESTLQRFTRVESDEGTLDVWTTLAGGHGLPIGALVARGGFSRAHADRLAATAVESGRAWLIDDRLFATGVAAALRDGIRRELGRFHAAHAAEPGMPREQLREATAANVAPALFDRVLQEMTSERAVKGTEKVALTTHQPAWTDADASARATVLAAVQAAGLLGADATMLAQAAAIDPRQIDRIAHLLVREHEIVKLDSLYFGAATLARLKEDVRALKSGASGAGARLDVATFKTRFGLTRRSAIPLLEWLDRERITRRAGEARLIL